MQVSLDSGQEEANQGPIASQIRSSLQSMTGT